MPKKTRVTLNGRKFHSAMKPWSAGSVYVNSLDQDDAARVPEAYAQNYARLCAVKAAYDSDNRFRRNQNIKPQVQAAKRTAVASSAISSARSGTRLVSVTFQWGSALRFP